MNCRTLFTVAVLATMLGCSREASTTVEEPGGWPKDAPGLIRHLNSWPKESLDICERPEAHPGMVDLGETGGWIAAHKRELRRLGVEVRWNSQLMQYEAVE